MIPLTVLILTYNERENIERTLNGLPPVDRVVVIDSYSTDDTCDIVSRHPKAEIVQRKFDNHTDQWNFGLEQVHSLWVLSLDADYVLTPELIAEIEALKPTTDVSGYSASFHQFVFGHPLRNTIYPPRTVLFRKDRAHYVEDGHTQRLRIEGTVLDLRGRIDHDDRKPLSRWLQSQDNYFKIEARHLRATPNEQLNRQDRLRKKIVFAPWIIFLYLLIGRGLIFDGWPGWFYVLERTIAEMLLALRLLTERERLESGSNPAER